jgi:hypothetical protein
MGAAMTLRHMVARECCNFRKGRCVYGVCLVLAGGLCPHFTRAVKPLAKTKTEYAGAVAEYQRREMKD